MAEYSKSRANRLEEQLNRISVLPLGLFIGQNYQLILKKESGTRRIMTSLRTVYTLFRVKLETFNTDQFDHISSSHDYVIITLIKNDSRYKSFILPILDELSRRGQRSILVAPADFIDSYKNVKHHNLELVDWDDFAKLPLHYSYPLFSRFRFVVTCIRNGLNAATALRLSMLAKLRVDRLNNFHLFLKTLNVKAVLTEYDRNSKVAPLIQASIFNNVPTYTLVHGSVFPPDTYYPFAAERVLTWGSRQLKILAALGYPFSKFTNVGNNRIDKVVSNAKVEFSIKERLGIFSNKKIVTLITNKVNEEDRLLYAKIFIESITALDGWFGIIKLHPLEKMSDYDRCLEDKDKTNIKILESRAISNYELSSITSVFINHNSIMGLEMLAQGKPVIILDCISYDLGIGREMIDNAGCIKAVDIASLRAAIITAEEHYAKSRPNFESYTKEYFYGIGNDATRNIVNCVLS